VTRAIRLRRDGKHVLVEVEYERSRFAVVIKEHWDGAFSHIVEPDHIDDICERARKEPDHG
jgi:hypothetical protein